ncbi:hypothetical protein SAMN05216282_101293 [Cryobacterium psychrotolerans]|uniref:YD repeat-containing protein n=1 Tax=Cryobacterium psychrotolerans TaxID=386301 RepID=A0A1G8XQ85_9MICO|nr:hypothetical protein SAMN05216282_101293 [Cryobacterium psychrotolerans]
MRSGEFDRGQQVGAWRSWDRAGRLVKKRSFRRIPTHNGTGYWYSWHG